MVPVTRMPWYTLIWLFVSFSFKNASESLFFSSSPKCPVVFTHSALKLWKKVKDSQRYNKTFYTYSDQN